MIDIDIIRSMHRPDLHQIALRSSKRVVPGPFDVICARGKEAYNHQGVSESERNSCIQIIRKDFFKLLYIAFTHQDSSFHLLIAHRRIGTSDK